MKKLESTLLNMVVVLVTVAVITSGLLAWVNHVTEEPIRMQDELALANGIKEVMGTDQLTVTSDEEVNKEFEGKQLSFVVHKTAAQPLTVNKDGGDIDAITASTITSRAFLKAVNQAYAVYAGQDDSASDGQSGASVQNGKRHTNPEDIR